MDLVNDALSYPATEEVIRLTVTPLETVDFIVRIESVSTGTTLTPSDGSMQPVPLSPGVWVVHADPAPLFTSGAMDRGRAVPAAHSPRTQQHRVAGRRDRGP